MQAGLRNREIRREGNSRAALKVPAQQSLASGTAAFAQALLLLLALSLPAFALRMETDEAGRKVTLPDHVHRLVCLTPSVTDSVFAIGAGSDVVGITDYTLYPPEARQKPSIGEVLRPSLERIAVLHPDLVIGVAAFNDAETIRGIERMGVPVFLVNSSGLKGLYSSIASIGRALARQSQASDLVLRLQARERSVRAQAASQAHPTVFLAISIDPCITAGHSAFINELLVAAGARPVTDDLPQEWINLSIEAIIPRKPSYVLLLKDAPFGLKEMREHAGWTSLDAVRAGRILRIDDRLQYPSPAAFDALEVLVRQLRSADSR